MPQAALATQRPADKLQSLEQPTPAMAVVAVATSLEKPQAPPEAPASW
jgi:hypothetical protein